MVLLVNVLCVMTLTCRIERLKEELLDLKLQHLQDNRMLEW